MNVWTREYILTFILEAKHKRNTRLILLCFCKNCIIITKPKLRGSFMAGSFCFGLIKKIKEGYYDLSRMAAGVVKHICKTGG